ncbi:MAG: hypothetical protein KKE30_09125 [Gammaproteobacteria bacterium]|nr:hypothetical protein [Gammaproteobacteria bacterium]MBU1556936.1 hypothetical protein [Gammaproteobacteria bacterium]MBU2069345.1 hypothetical protein [Gammaproteobacteria bacterium]MBU2183398.1 hypothetical protein [Gammaproteobacteria bacterium]MBU2204555.1 hypothetical protein [Gammaproteobacteria bacterium]
MKQLIPTLVLLLCGCVQQGPANNVRLTGEPPAERSQRVEQQPGLGHSAPDQFYRQQPITTVNEYSRNIVHELMQQHQALDDNAMVAVTDLSYTDSTLDQGSLFGHHFSEAMIYDLHRFGVPVLDYKATDYIRVTPDGDFVLSRNFEELKAELPIKYVITGTMTMHQQGLLVNARLIQIDTKRVISAARTFVPNHIVRALQQWQQQQTLRLKQG